MIISIYNTRRNSNICDELAIMQHFENNDNAKIQRDFCQIRDIEFIFRTKKSQNKRVTKSLISNEKVNYDKLFIEKKTKRRKL